MEKKKRLRLGLVSITGLLILAVIIICVVKLLIWNQRSVIVDTDVEEGSFDIECLDYYVYPDKDALKNHPDDGEENILIIGNCYANNMGEKHSVVNVLKEKTDANIIDISTDAGRVTTQTDNLTYGYDAFSLFFLTQQLIDGDYHNLELSSASPAFLTDARKDYFMKQIETVDLNKIDTVLIMYSLVDFYGSLPTLVFDESNKFGFRGSLSSSVKMLQENYPHLQIVVVSPYPEYILKEDGSMEMSNASDYGWGNSSVYFDHEYVTATELCVSFIDNYFYCINDSNITEYVDQFYLTDKGIDAVANHIISFLKDKGSNN